MNLRPGMSAKRDLPSDEQTAARTAEWYEHIGRMVAEARAIQAAAGGAT